MTATLKIGNFKTACGYWYGTIFIALKRTTSCIIMPEGSVTEDLSHMENRKPATSHIFMSALFHKRKMTEEYSHQLTLNKELNGKR